MHPAYYQNISNSNGAILARAALDGQLNEQFYIYKLLSKLVKKHSEGASRDKILFFIAQMFIGGAYEAIASFLDSDFLRRRDDDGRFKKLREEEPVFEFFYHCRNASFHGNKFKFIGRIYNAKWKEHEIKLSDKEKQLFPDKLNTDEVVPLVKDVMKLL